MLWPPGGLAQGTRSAQLHVSDARVTPGTGRGTMCGASHYLLQPTQLMHWRQGPSPAHCEGALGQAVRCKTGTPAGGASRRRVARRLAVVQELTESLPGGQLSLVRLLEEGTAATLASLTSALHTLGDTSYLHSAWASVRDLRASLAAVQPAVRRRLRMGPV